jgi:hypothetical protein
MEGGMLVGLLMSLGLVILHFWCLFEITRKAGETNRLLDEIRTSLVRAETEKGEPES